MVENESLQSLANQISWCKTTKEYFISLNNELHSVSVNYETTLRELADRGYMADLLPQLHQMEKEFEKSSRELVAHIEQEHLTYIEKQSDGILGALEMLTGQRE